MNSSERLFVNDVMSCLSLKLCHVLKICVALAKAPQAQPPVAYLACKVEVLDSFGVGVGTALRLAIQDMATVVCLWNTPVFICFSLFSSSFLTL
jgi:hypothetical protein